MARQLPDLPRINDEDLNNEDILLVRDVSAKKDKRVLLEDIVGFVLKDGSIVASKLADNSVEESKIKNSAVTKNKIKNSAIDRNKLDWAAFDFKSKTLQQSLFNITPSWTAKDVPNHNFTFTGVVGAKYKVIYHSAYVANLTDNNETDCLLTVVSGLSELTGNGRITMTGVHGNGRTMQSYYTATDTSCSIKVQAICGTNNASLRFDGGYFAVERVG